MCYKKIIMAINNRFSRYKIQDQTPVEPPPASSSPVRRRGHASQAANAGMQVGNRVFRQSFGNECQFILAESRGVSCSERSVYPRVVGVSGRSSGMSCIDLVSVSSQYGPLVGNSLSG
jgi:hypothetical protein